MGWELAVGIVVFIIWFSRPSQNAMQLFYDGSCVFCKREIGIVRSFDRGKTHKYIDISKAEFDAAAHGLDAARVNKYFSGIREGTAITEGPETVYHAMREIGCEWLVFPLRFHLIRKLVAPVYELYARWRVPISNKLGRSCEGSCSR